MNEIVDTIEYLLERKFGKECDHGRMKLPNWIGNLAEKVDALIQYLGFYEQKIHVLSEMNKTIACNVSRAKDDLGYSPEFSLRKGMENSLSELYN